MVIENNSQANWSMRKIKEITKELEKVERYAEEEKKLIEEWRIKEVKPLNEALEYHKALLMAYYSHNKSLDPKFKLSVPNGKITSRKSKKYNYEDEDKLAEWININYPNMIKVVRSFNKVEFKKQFKDGIDNATGELIPFISVTEEESHTIKINELGAE